MIDNSLRQHALYGRARKASVSDLLGHTLAAIENIFDAMLIFETATGRAYKLFHAQDYEELVTIESVVGDLADLVGAPLLLANESSNSTGGLQDLQSPRSDLRTWTFYRFATIKGSVDIRWFGESNGYYSTSVDFAEILEGRRGDHITNRDREEEKN